MDKVDPTAPVAGDLSLRDIAETISLYWKYRTYPDPRISDLNGFVSGREDDDRNIIYFKGVRAGEIGIKPPPGMDTGPKPWVFSLHYELVGNDDPDFDIQAPYTIDRSTAYKTKRRTQQGRFRLSHVKIEPENIARLVDLHKWLTGLERETQTLRDWAGAGHAMHVTCANSDCDASRKSKPFSATDVQRFFDKFETFEALKNALRCRQCGRADPDLSLMAQDLGPVSSFPSSPPRPRRSIGPQKKSRPLQFGGTRRPQG